MLQAKQASEESFVILPRGKGTAEETGGEAETFEGLCVCGIEGIMAKHRICC